jgi:hypothetical protein
MLNSVRHNERQQVHKAMVQKRQSASFRDHLSARHVHVAGAMTAIELPSAAHPVVWPQAERVPYAN